MMMYLFTTVPHPHGHWQLQELLGNHLKNTRLWLGREAHPISSSMGKIFRRIYKAYRLVQIISHPTLAMCTTYDDQCINGSSLEEAWPPYSNPSYFIAWGLAHLFALTHLFLKMLLEINGILRVVMDESLNGKERKSALHEANCTTGKEWIFMVSWYLHVWKGTATPESELTCLKKCSAHKVLSHCWRCLTSPCAWLKVMCFHHHTFVSYGIGKLWFSLDSWNLTGCKQ